MLKHRIFGSPEVNLCKFISVISLALCSFIMADYSCIIVENCPLVECACYLDSDVQGYRQYWFFGTPCASTSSLWFKNYLVHKIEYCLSFSGTGMSNAEAFAMNLVYHSLDQQLQVSTKKMHIVLLDPHLRCTIYINMVSG